MNSKIGITVLGASITSFLILILITGYLNETVTEDSRYVQQKFYEQLDTNQKIFLIGSSHLIALNATHIQDYLKNNHQSYEVYNLAIGGDKINERVKTVDMIIHSKPDIVVYGIASDDFVDRRSLKNVDDQKQQNYMPDPSGFFHDMLTSFGSNFNYESIEHPRELVGNFLFKITEQPNQIDNRQTSMPFVSITDEEVKIIDKNELKPRPYNEFGIIQTPIKNKRLAEFKEILKELKNNNIKIIIFTTPYSRVFLDSIPSSNTATFNLILKQISDEFDMKIYSLTYRYADLNIWHDYQHLAITKNSIIYSDDIAKIILTEIVT